MSKPVAALGRMTLRDRLIGRYNELKTRLARRLGSSDRAEEALHDTFTRLDDTQEMATIRNPDAYLLRAAYNTALNIRRAENRFLAAAEIDALLRIADDAPGAARILEGRADFERLKAVMAELPSRQREILLAVRLRRTPQKQIAARLGISLSTVEKELRKAQAHCAARFNRAAD